MITVSIRAGLHSQACDAGYLWSHDMDKQWRKPRIFIFRRDCCLNATGRFRLPKGVRVRMMIFGASDGRRSSTLASSHGARIQTSRFRAKDSGLTPGNYGSRLRWIESRFCVSRIAIVNYREERAGDDGAGCNFWNDAGTDAQLGVAGVSDLARRHWFGRARSRWRHTLTHRQNFKINHLIQHPITRSTGRTRSCECAEGLWFEQSLLIDGFFLASRRPSGTENGNCQEDAVGGRHDAPSFLRLQARQSCRRA
jgi:hypothetical protein